MANMLEVYTTNGSLDTAIIAGTESMANIISEISTKEAKDDGCLAYAGELSRTV